MSEIKIDSKVTLNNGVEMPLFGLGTYLTRVGKETYEAVSHALEAGYRLIDTAAFYGNEKDIGEALRKSGIPRDEIFITTKLWNSDHGYESALTACEKSLENLGLDYIDLYLIHWPVQGLRHESWRALEILLKKEKCRAVGVSNYMIWHVKEVLEGSSTIPAVNQVEFHPYLYLKDLQELCRSFTIHLEAYSSLTKGRKLNYPDLRDIASKYSKTPAQILIRWGLQKGVTVIPKSSKRERIYENADVFDFTLSPEDMDILDSFDENLHTSWDPSHVL